MWLALFLVAVSGTAQAQALFKCVGGAGVTYSSTPCEKLGLKPGGEIRDRVTTLPPSSPDRRTGPSSQAAKPPQAGGNANEIDLPKTSTVKPVNPLIERLAK